MPRTRPRSSWRPTTSTAAPSTIVGFSTDEQYRKGFGPFTPGFRIVPFGDAEALRARHHARHLAFLVEPIQGEAGISFRPPGTCGRRAEICRQNNMLLMLDEIQSGLGRTGKLFAFKHEGIRPDVLILGKALAAASIPCPRSAALARSSASIGPATTARPSAAIPWLAPWPERPCGSSWTRTWWSARPSWASTSWTSCGP